MECSGTWNVLVQGLTWYIAWPGTWHVLVHRLACYMACSGTWNVLVQGLTWYIAWPGTWHVLLQGLTWYMVWPGTWPGLAHDLAWPGTWPYLVQGLAWYMACSATGLTWYMARYITILWRATLPRARAVVHTPTCVTDRATLKIWNAHTEEDGQFKASTTQDSLLSQVVPKTCRCACVSSYTWRHLTMMSPHGWTPPPPVTSKPHNTCI